MTGVVALTGAVASFAVPVATAGAASAPSPPRIVAVALGRPVVAAVGGASALRVQVEGGVTCWLAAPKEVLAVRAHRGCRSGRFATALHLKASDTTVAARYAVTAWVQGGNGETAKRALVLRQTGLAPLRVTTTSVPPMAVGSPYATRLTASGGRGGYRWSVAAGTLPPGIALSAGGAMTGTPTTGGTFSSTLALEDRSTPKPLRMTVAVTLVVSGASASSSSPAGSGASSAPDSPLVLAPPSLSGVSVGVGYLAVLGASGGTSPYTWAITGGSLPPGISLSSDGSLSGTPTTAGTFTATAQATDASPIPETATETLTITVAPASTPTITTTSLPDAVVGTAYATTLAISGGTAPYSCTLTAGTLPAGLSLSSAGVISGTPAASATTQTFTVQATDSSSSPQSATGSLTLTVVAPLVISGVTATALSAATPGKAYEATLFSVTGGSAPYAAQVSSGALPAGLSLGVSGANLELSGTPGSGTAGTYPFVAQVADASSPAQIERVSFSLTVAPP